MSVLADTSSQELENFVEAKFAVHIPMLTCVFKLAEICCTSPHHLYMYIISSHTVRNAYSA